jgi:hypothetical protein
MEDNSEVVSWFIDRTPHYDTQHSQDTIVEETQDYVEATDYLGNYDPGLEYHRTRMLLEEFSLQPRISNRNYEVNEVFIPFEVVVMKPNFIIDRFELSEEEKTCCICMTEHNSEQICKLNCSHTFCVKCINNCLERNVVNCPLCRTYITQIRKQI